MSNSVRNSFQMMNYARKIKSNQVWYFNKTQMDNFPTDINTILKNYNKRIQNENSVNKLIKSRADLNGINIGNDCREYLNIDNIWICLMLIQEANSNMSRNFYEEIFIKYINNSNGTITENHIEETIELCNFCDNYKQLHDQIKILLKKNQTERFKNIKYDPFIVSRCKDFILKCITKRIDKETVIKYEVESKVSSLYLVPPEIIKTINDKGEKIRNIRKELDENDLYVAY
jgi:hypothetical protein